MNYSKEEHIQYHPELDDAWNAQRPEFKCAVCGVNTLRINEYYMLKHEVWKLAAEQNEFQMLCIGCVEKGLGRPLTSEDFLDASINKSGSYSYRLRDRMARL